MYDSIVFDSIVFVSSLDIACENILGMPSNKEDLFCSYAEKPGNPSVSRIVRIALSLCVLLYNAFAFLFLHISASNSGGVGG